MYVYVCMYVDKISKEIAISKFIKPLENLL